MQVSQALANASELAATVAVQAVVFSATYLAIELQLGGASQRALDLRVAVYNAQSPRGRHGHGTGVPMWLVNENQDSEVRRIE